MDFAESSPAENRFHISKAFVILLILVVASSLLFYSESTKQGVIGGVSDDDFVDVRVVGVYMDSLSSSPVVYLLEPKEEVYLPIWIGANEAIAIQSELNGVKPPRPLTNDLLKTVIEELGATLERVRITRVEDDTYFAELSLTGGDNKRLQIDARPSDAIGLSLRFKCSLQVHRQILKTYGVTPEQRRQKEKTKKS